MIKIRAMEKNKITFKVIFILLALFSLVFPLYPGSSEYTNNGEWPVYRGSLTGTRATDVFGALSPFILWNFTYSAVDRGDGRGSFIPESSPASVVLGTVFIANNAGQVTAINITDGSIIWEKNVSNAGAPVCIGPPAIIST
jgi:outer membrane protein assembly factor BamB